MLQLGLTKEAIESRKNRDAQLKRFISISHEGPMVLFSVENYIFKLHYADMFAYLHWGRIAVKAAKYSMGLDGFQFNTAAKLTNAEYYKSPPPKPIDFKSAAIVLKDKDIILKQDMGITYVPGEVIFILKGLQLKLFFGDASKVLQWLRVEAKQAKNSLNDTTIYTTSAETLSDAEENFRAGNQHF